MHPRVERALAAQYEAFRAPPPRKVRGCEFCCISEAELKDLVRTPRGQLSVEQLRSFAANAINTVGEIEDLRHFWPRIAELTVTGELMVDAEIVFTKPHHGEWRTWPAEEQDALVELAHAQIEALAEGGADGESVDVWVSAFGQFLEDVTPILDPLLLPISAACRSLREWYKLNRQTLADCRMWSPFWEGRAGEAKLCAWFREPAVTSALHRAGA